MKREELTKTFMMISNWTKPFGLYCRSLWPIKGCHGYMLYMSQARSFIPLVCSLIRSSRARVFVCLLLACSLVRSSVRLIMHSLWNNCIIIFSFIHTFPCVFTSGTNTHCVDKCKNRDNGNYQSCNGCNVYVTCINGQMIDNRPCAGGTEWDDIQRTCVAPGNSTTCSSGVTRE